MVDGSNNSRDPGVVAEMLFAVAAIKHGAFASKPLGDTAQYDIVVDFKGKLSRVQVKATDAKPTKTGSYHVPLRCCNGIAGRRYYTSADTDFVAIYLKPRDRWYIIPIAAVRSSVSIPRNGSGSFVLYEEAWHLLKEGPTAATPAA